MSPRRAVQPEATTASNSSASERVRMVTERAATSLKYQGQCIANGEQNLAVLAVRAAIEVGNSLMRAIMSGEGRRQGWWRPPPTRKIPMRFCTSTGRLTQRIELSLLF